MVSDHLIYCHTVSATAEPERCVTVMHCRTTSKRGWNSLLIAQSSCTGTGKVAAGMDQMGFWEGLEWASGRVRDVWAQEKVDLNCRSAHRDPIPFSRLDPPPEALWTYTTIADMGLRRPIGD